jgi:AraC-like DNA-binding protein
MSGREFHLKKGDFVIWTHGKLVSDITVSEDLNVTVLYVSYQFVRKNAPNNDYDIIGNLSLPQNPVLSLTENEMEICSNDLKQIKKRLNDTSHRFYSELMGCLVVTFFLDLYDIHARIYKDNPVSEQNALLLRRFIDLLEKGEYKSNREVSLYAEKLFVTPKYLSEVCKKVSGHSATFWIDRFTITEITRQLKNKEHTLTTIAEEMNFSSISYFSRYVQRILGISPTEYRQRLDRNAQVTA